MSRASRDAWTAAAYRQEALAALALMVCMCAWLRISRWARCVRAHLVSVRRSVEKSSGVSACDCTVQGVAVNVNMSAILRRNTELADAAPAALDTRRARTVRAPLFSHSKVRRNSANALMRSVFLEPAGLAAPATARCPHAVDGAFRSLQGTSGEPRDFGAAGTVCAVAAGRAAAAVATGLDHAWSLSGRTACRCSVLHFGHVRARHHGLSTSTAAERLTTSTVC